MLVYGNFIYMNIETKIMKFEDLEFFLEVRNECRHYLHCNKEFAYKDVCEWFFKEKRLYYTIFKDGIRVGIFRIKNWDNENRHTYVGCDIHKDYRGQGIATASYTKMLDWIFCYSHIHKVYLEVLSNNTAIKLYKKLGFVEEGRKLQDIRRGPNEYLDSIIMALYKRGWNESKNR